MSAVFDSHAHYDDKRFDSELNRNEIINELISAKDVCGIVNSGTNIETSGKSLELANKYDIFYATVGIHPNDSMYIDEKDSDSVIGCLKSMLKEDKAVAIGEIGLDFYYDGFDRAVQERWFIRQMDLAREVNMPVVIHDRDAHGAVMDILRQYPDVTGILHSFSGSREMAAELIRMGWYISFSGVITFKNATRIAEVVKSIPKDRILIETDCPYLAPHPMRGKCNHSGYLKYTAAKAAELLEMSYDEFCSQICENALSVFRIVK